MRGTRPYAEWVQTRPRNEALDCWKYALAALRLSGIDLKSRAAVAVAPEKLPETAASKTPFVQKPTRPGGFVKGWK